MTRRDTIISAALINAGLLVILFVCALGVEDSLEQKAAHASLIPSLQSSGAVNAGGSGSVSNQSVISDSSSEIIALNEVKEPIVVVVQKGERLDTIAAAHGVSVERLVDFNRLSSTQLVVGQQIQIPATEAASSSLYTAQANESSVVMETPSAPFAPITPKPRAPVKKVASASGGSSDQHGPSMPKGGSQSGPKSSAPQYHYVQKGENPWIIGKKYGISVDALLKLNHLDEATARKLRQGDRLRVK